MPQKRGSAPNPAWASLRPLAFTFVHVNEKYPHLRCGIQLEQGVDADGLACGSFIVRHPKGVIGQPQDLWLDLVQEDTLIEREGFEDRAIVVNFRTIMPEPPVLCSVLCLVLYIRNGTRNLSRMLV